MTNQSPSSLASSQVLLSSPTSLRPRIPWSQASPEAILSDDFLFSRPCVSTWVLHASWPLLSSSVTPLGLTPSDYNGFPVFIPPSPYHCHPPGTVPCAGENPHSMPYLRDIMRPSSPFHLHYPPLQVNCSNFPLPNMPASSTAFQPSSCAFVLQSLWDH